MPTDLTQQDETFINILIITSIVDAFKIGMPAIAVEHCLTVFYRYKPVV